MEQRCKHLILWDAKAIVKVRSPVSEERVRLQMNAYARPNMTVKPDEGQARSGDFLQKDAGSHSMSNQVKAFSRLQQKTGKR